MAWDLFFMDLGLFASKSFLVVFSIGLVLVLIAILVARASDKFEIEVQALHHKIKEDALMLKELMSTKEELKEQKKRLKEEMKAEEKEGPKKKFFVLNFKGDIHASRVEGLRQEITVLLGVASEEDEVIVRLESPGGVVSDYGLAASQLMRLRSRKIPLTVCVDTVAASGGYMMACVANKILAAPFAIVGSIGVVAQVPNFHRLLKKHDVDYTEYTAGEFKRTVSILGEITPQGEEKFKQQLEETHVLFKDYVQNHRPQLSIKDVATGEYWFGEVALKKGLVDALMTSDDYIMEASTQGAVYEITYNIKEKWKDKISHMISAVVEKSFKAALKIIEQKTKYPL